MILICIELSVRTCRIVMLRKQNKTFDIAVYWVLIHTCRNKMPWKKDCFCDVDMWWSFIHVYMIVMLWKQSMIFDIDVFEIKFEIVMLRCRQAGQCFWNWYVMNSDSDLEDQKISKADWDFLYVVGIASERSNWKKKSRHSTPCICRAVRERYNSISSIP